MVDDADRPTPALHDRVAKGSADVAAGRVRPFEQVLPLPAAPAPSPQGAHIMVSDTARDDIVAIHRHLASVGRGHADAFAARIAERAAALAAAPDRGRPLESPDGDPDLRSMLLAPYRIVYSATGDALVVLAVLAPATGSPSD